MSRQADQEDIAGDEETSSRSDFTRCVQFHGHACPGLAIGFQAARILMFAIGDLCGEPTDGSFV